MYNLYIKNFYLGSKDGCLEEDNVCIGFVNKLKKCGDNGRCELVVFFGITRCVCNLGFRGDICEISGFYILMFMKVF